MGIKSTQKNCSSSLVMREMQNQITMRHRYTPIQTTKTENAGKRVYKDVGQPGRSFIAGGNVSETTT